MATVVFSSDLQKVTGETQTTVAARDYRTLVDELVARYDTLERSQLLELAVSIDGVIIHDPLLEPVGEDSEVHFLFRISGG